jgi:hypothetical protein
MIYASSPVSSMPCKQHALAASSMPQTSPGQNTCAAHKPREQIGAYADCTWPLPQHTQPRTKCAHATCTRTGWRPRCRMCLNSNCLSLGCPCCAGRASPGLVPQNCCACMSSKSSHAMVLHAWPSGHDTAWSCMHGLARLASRYSQMVHAARRLQEPNTSRHPVPDLRDAFFRLKACSP